LQKQMEDDQKQHGIERTKLADKIKELEFQLKEKMDLTDDSEIANKTPLDDLQKQMEDAQKQNDIERTKLEKKIKELALQLKLKTKMAEGAEIMNKSIVNGLKKRMENGKKQHDIKNTQLEDKIKELDIKLKESKEEETNLSNKLKQAMRWVESSQSFKSQSASHISASVEINSDSTSVDESNQLFKLPICESESDDDDIAVPKKRKKQQKKTSSPTTTTKKVDDEGFQWIADSSSDDDSADEWEKDREIYRHNQIAEKQNRNNDIIKQDFIPKEKDLAVIAMERMEEMEVRRKGVMISDVWKKPKKIVIDYHPLSDIEEVDEDEEDI